MMTRQDYWVLASAFAKAFDGITSDATRLGVTIAVQVVANALEAQNPRFDRMVFYDAANVPPRSMVYRRAAKAARIQAMKDLNG